MSLAEIGAAPAVGGMAPEEREDLCSLLDRLCETVSCNPEEGAERVTLGDVLDKVGRWSYGPVLLLIGLFSVSPLTAIPGATWAAAAVTFLVAGQMLIGRPNPWLPRAARNTQVSRRLLVSGVDKARPLARRIDAMLKPRFEILSHPPFVNVVALMVMAAALVTIPLGLVPLAPIAPGLAVVLFGLGMTARDGLVLALGTAAVGGALWLVWRLPGVQLPGLF